MKKLKLFEEFLFFILLQESIIVCCSKIWLKDAEFNVELFTKEVNRFLQRIYDEQEYQNIYWQQSGSSEYCGVGKGIASSSIPLVLANNNNNLNDTLYLKGKFNSEMLAVLCVDYLKDLKALHRVATHLQHMRDTRLVVINFEIDSQSLTKRKELMWKFFKECETLKLLNVVVIHANSFKENRYDSYTQIPEFALEERDFQNALVFPYRLNNFQGKVVLTLPDQSEPITMLYKDRTTGEYRMLGYVGKLLHLFADRYNCTLRFPYNLTDDFDIFLSDLRMLTRNNTIDIAASSSTPQRDLNIHEYTMIFEIAKWCIMVPIEKSLTRNTLILSSIGFSLGIVITLEGFLVSLLIRVQRRKEKSVHRSKFAKLWNTFFNDRILRGMFGLPFALPKDITRFTKYLYSLVFVIGLFVSTSYSANLMKGFTAPPKEKPVMSFADAKDRGLRIYYAGEELTNIVYFTGEQFWQEYRSIFIEIPSYIDYQTFRHKLNPEFGYTMLSNTWVMVKNQQKYFSKQIFRYSTELSIAKQLNCGIPINENSIYKRPLNQYLMHAREHGFMRHWFAMSFYDLLALKRLKVTNINQRDEAQLLRLGDFYGIFTLLCGFLMLSIIVFIGELIYFKKFENH